MLGGGLNPFLEKYSKLFTADNVRQWLIDYCSKEFGLNLSKRDIDVRNGVLRVESHSALKNELFIRQREIIEALQKEFGKDSPRAVR